MCADTARSTAAADTGPIGKDDSENGAEYMSKGWPRNSEVGTANSKSQSEDSYNRAPDGDSECSRMSTLVSSNRIQRNNNQDSDLAREGVGHNLHVPAFVLTADVACQPVCCQVVPGA